MFFVNIMNQNLVYECLTLPPNHNHLVTIQIIAYLI